MAAEGETELIEAEIIDLSLTGCYLANGFPFKVGNVVEITAELADEPVTIQGIVKTSDFGAGNGIEFKRVSLKSVALLDRYLRSVIKARAKAAVSS